MSRAGLSCRASSFCCAVAAAGRAPTREALAGPALIFHEAHVPRKTWLLSDGSSRSRGSGSHGVNETAGESLNHPLWPHDGQAGRTCPCPASSAREQVLSTAGPVPWGKVQGACAARRKRRRLGGKHLSTARASGALHLRAVSLTIRPGSLRIRGGLVPGPTSPQPPKSLDTQGPPIKGCRMCINLHASPMNFKYVPTPYNP